MSRGNSGDDLRLESTPGCVGVVRLQGGNYRSIPYCAGDRIGNLRHFGSVHEQFTVASNSKCSRSSVVTRLIVNLPSVRCADSRSGSRIESSE